MFLTLLIGGRDYGQVRHGLLTQPEVAPAVTAAAFDPEKITPEDSAEQPVALATFVPVAAPEPAVAAPVVEAVAPLAADASPAVETLPVRWVKAGSINMRDGPSTENAVIGRLTRNEAVSIVSEAADGWVLVRIEGDGAEGYVASRLLTDQAP